VDGLAPVVAGPGRRPDPTAEGTNGKGRYLAGDSHRAESAGHRSSRTRRRPVVEYFTVAAKRRIDGLALRATDADWAHGSGPEVSGPILSLVMVMTGRQAALGDLSAEGVATLRARP
jgi:hypothetical protein